MQPDVRRADTHSWFEKANEDLRCAQIDLAVSIIISEVHPSMANNDRLPPIHAGEILREEFLSPLGMSAHALALALRVPATRIHDIVHDKRGITRVAVTWRAIFERWSGSVGGAADATGPVKVWWGRASWGETFERFLPHTPSSNVPPLAPAEVMASGSPAAGSLLLTSV